MTKTLKITLEGPRQSGKTLVGNAIKRFLEEKGFSGITSIALEDLPEGCPLDEALANLACKTQILIVERDNMS